MKKISIITPLFNRYDLVQATWNSIKDQYYTNWEWIVVDDGSTDEGPDYIRGLTKQDARVRFFVRNSGLKGPSTCRNLGVSYSTGEYLLFLDSDDLISKECLQKRFQFLDANPSLDFAVFTQVLFYGHNVKDITMFTKFFSDKGEYLKAFIADQHPWPISGPLWQKKSFQKLGGFREDYTIMEDPELHIRALLAGMNFKVVDDEPDFFYRQMPKTPQQEERFWDNSIKGRMVYYRDILELLHSDELKKALSKGIINFYKGFLLARITKYQAEHSSFLNWLKSEKLITPTQALLLDIYNKVAIHSYLKQLPFVKGVLFKLL